ncbi:cell division protein FtsQ, partial [Peptoniphilus indolicus ATCC 29427]
YKYIDQNQSDEKSLKNIIVASNNIANNILNKIQKEFNVKEECKLLWISGKVIFVSDLSEGKIKEKLVGLYREVYMEYNGNVFLNYSTFERNNLSEIEIIGKANIDFKSNSTKVRVIQENQDLLFKFQEFTTKKFEPEIEGKKLNINGEVNYSEVFLNNMDDLIDIVDKDTSSTDGKIAIVKADINDLGDTLQKLDSYDKFKNISKILEEYISIEHFAKSIIEYNSKIGNKILPFYIAGDDIFYSVNIDYLFDSIKILKSIISQINNRIKAVLINEESNGKEYKSVSIAVGVTFVNNHQPIRYYRQLVEKELSAAKHMMKSDKENLSIVGLSISGCKLNWYKNKCGRGKNDGFNRLCSEIKELNMMFSKNIFTSTSLHNLLINLENEKSLEKKMLYVLYYCRPKLVANKGFDEEVYFKKYILSQLIEEPKGNEERFFDKNKIGTILIPKLKLILLLLKKSKNNLKQGKQNKNYSKSCNGIYSRELNKFERAKDTKVLDKGNVCSIILNKPINFLLEEAGKDGIEKLFIVKCKKGEKILYKTARFEPSIFFRAKELLEKNKKEQLIVLFKNYYENIIRVKNENRTNNIHEINFDIDEFERKLKKYDPNIGPYNDIWIDRLIVLFEYNKQRIIYKTYKKNMG